MKNIFGDNTKIWICTNGILLNRNINKYLSDNNINIGISLDGNKDVHNKNRYFENGLGSYDTIERNINQIKGDKNLSNIYKELWGLSVITMETQNILEILKHHYSLGFNNVQFKIVRGNKDNGIGLSKNTIQYFIELYEEFSNNIYNDLKNNFEYLVMILNFNDIYGKLLLRLILNEVCHYRCSAGVGKYSVTASGEIYPCDSFVGIKSLKLGSIYEGIDKELQKKFINNSIFNRTDCKECWIHTLCGGDCPYNSYLSNNDISIADNDFCVFNRKLVENAIWLLDVIWEEDKDKYNYILKIARMRQKIGSR